MAIKREKVEHDPEASGIKYTDMMIVKKYGKLIKATKIKKSTDNLSNRKRVSKTAYEYTDKETGESTVKQYKENDTKIIQNIQRSMNELRSILEGNFTNDSTSVFITLSYNGKMRAYKQVTTDFSRFIKNLEKECNSKSRKLLKLEYVRVIEADEEGSFHLHICVKERAGVIIHHFVDLEAKKLWKRGSVDWQIICRNHRLGE